MIEQKENGFTVTASWEEGEGDNCNYKSKTWIFTDRKEALKKVDEVL